MERNIVILINGTPVNVHNWIGKRRAIGQDKLCVAENKKLLDTLSLAVVYTP